METLWSKLHHWQCKTMFYSSATLAQKCLHMASSVLHLMDCLLAAASLHSATLSTRCSCNCKIYSSLKPPTAAAAFSHNAQAAPFHSLCLLSLSLVGHLLEWSRIEPSEGTRPSHEHNHSQAGRQTNFVGGSQTEWGCEGGRRGRGCR